MSDSDYYLESAPAQPESDRLWNTWGTIYLLHFSKPLAHAKHYLGFALNLENRIAEHMAGKGSALTRAVVRAGIELALVRTREGDRKTERDLKNLHNLGLFCPLCKSAIGERAKLRMRRIRQNKKDRARRERVWLGEQ